MITCNHDVSYLSISLSWLLNLFFTWALTSSSRFLSSELGTCHCKWPPDLVSTLWSHIACQVAVLSYLVVVVILCHLLVFDCCCCNFASWNFQRIFTARVDTASATRPGLLLIPLVMYPHPHLANGFDHGDECKSSRRGDKHQGNSDVWDDLYRSWAGSRSLCPMILWLDGISRDA